MAEPAGPGIRNDSALYRGYEIPVHYDPLVSKLIAYGNSREEAIRRMLRALREYRVGGIPTSVSFLRRLISNPDFQAGKLHTGFLEEHHLFDEEVTENAYVPLAGAAVEHLLVARRPSDCVQHRTNNRWKLMGRPTFTPANGREPMLTLHGTHNGEAYEIKISKASASASEYECRVTKGNGFEKRFYLDVISHIGSRWTIRVDGKIEDLVISRHDGQILIDWNNRNYRLSIANPKDVHDLASAHHGLDQNLIRADMTGKVVTVSKKSWGAGGSRGIPGERRSDEDA